MGKDLETYCNKYRIPIEYVFQILEDQKVVPMIRGKATEYSAYLLIKEMLNDAEWSVHLYRQWLPARRHLVADHPIPMGSSRAYN